MAFLESAWNLFMNNWELFLRGAWTALLLAIIGTICGTGIGFFIGIMHTIPQRKKSFKTIVLKIFNFILTAYVEIFRGTLSAASPDNPSVNTDSPSSSSGSRPCHTV